MNRFLLLVMALLSFTTSSFAEDTWTVAGTKLLFGSEWDPTDPLNNMTTSDGVVYTLAKTGVALFPGTTYEYKVVKNHNWGTTGVDNFPVENKTFSINALGIYDITITFDTDSKSLSHEIQAASVEPVGRSAPVMPSAQTLESGKTYYLYNVGSSNFVYRDGSRARANATTMTGIVITSQEDETYTLQFTDNNCYWYMATNGADEMNTRSSLNPPCTNFRIAETEGGYTIQRNYYYDETHFVGNNNDYYVRANQTSGNIVWQLYDADGAEAMLRYKAKKALYDALEAAAGYEFAIAEYEAIYENESSTNDALYAAAIALNKSLSMSNGHQTPWWNERPVLFYSPDSWSIYDDHFEEWTCKKGQWSISATVKVEEPSTLIYGIYGHDGARIDVSVDGVEVRSLDGIASYSSPSDKTHARFFEELEPGQHTITWTCVKYDASFCRGFYIYDVGVMSKPQITVNLLEPGSLGTEVLYNTDHVKNVRRLKVKGAMNSDDWAKIKMMSTLLELDLSEAQFTEIPADQFKVSSNDTTMNFLHKVVLPEGLTKINDYAFYYSFVEDINLPSTMKRVGRSAFAYSHVKELIMPDDMTDFYGGDDSGYCFSHMYWLKKLVMPKNLTRIPESTFYQGYYITEAVMPEKLQTVGYRAFYSCQRMQTTLPEGLKTIERYGFYDCPTLNSPLPSTLTTIGEYAFQHARGYKSLVIPQSVTSIGDYAFENCTNLENVELGVNQYSLANGVFRNCDKLTSVKLNSPTVTTISSTYPLSDITTVTLQVPHYLVNEYKLHSYWYNAAAIEPFDYSSIDFIPIHGKLTLNHERFGGQPSIHVHEDNCYLKINGENEQKFNEIWVSISGSKTGQLLNNCDKVTANGDNKLDYSTEAKKWYFISLPFDLDVSRITSNNASVQYAIRYYDGEGRAANGKSGNWKNVDNTSIIPAGTGFIYQTNIGTWTSFYAADTENKYGTLRTTEFTKTLAVNASETASNKGWNLVGNPYQCFYNNHCLNFTAPITVWNGSTYVAYSLTDDDYVIRPNEAFFVQCPNEEYNTIGFPLQGRQLTSVIESQNAVKALVPKALTRQIINLTVSNGEWEDQTRVVLNENASMAYEASCDASKFISMDGSVPQIYTMDNESTWYAINERPLAEGTIALGFYAGHDGDYTISATRCDAKQMFITDNLTGVTTDITSDAYSFSANAGTDITRFTLSFVANETTGIEDVNKTDNVDKADVYSIEGKFLGTDVSRLGTGVYILRQGKKANKVVVR